MALWQAAPGSMPPPSVQIEDGINHYPPGTRVVRGPEWGRGDTAASCGPPGTIGIVGRWGGNASVC
jgi:hypothetical protein